MTPGCTKEACNLSENYHTLKEKNIEILGVSLDYQASHQKFTKKYNLPFPLVSDIKAEVSKKYDVYKQKSFLGKKFLGIERTTFIINPKGKIESIIRDVKVSDHATQILDSIKRAKLH